MSQQVNKEFKNNVFNNIEQTGENFKQQFEKLMSIAQKRIDSQVNCAKFEAAYGLSISKKERQKTMKDVKEIRKELWKEALNKAKGKSTDAYEIYCEICSFD
jgi:protein-disulfide isomerase-like protein with CxxC motif